MPATDETLEPTLLARASHPGPAAGGNHGRRSTRNTVCRFFSIALWAWLTPACAQSSTPVTAEADAGPADISGVLLDVDGRDLVEQSVTDTSPTDAPDGSTPDDGDQVEQDASPVQDAGPPSPDISLGCPAPTLDPACLPGTPTLCSDQFGPTWDQHGGNRANTGLFPVPVGASLKLDWKAQVGSTGWSAPLAVGTGGHIYLPFFHQGPAKPVELTFSGLRALTWGGAVQWTGPPIHHYCHGSAAVASGGEIYAHCGNGKLYKYASDGAVLWSIFVGWSYTWGSSPRVGTDGAVRLANANGLVSVSSNGKVQWNRPELATAAMAIAMGVDDSVYVQEVSGLVVRVDAQGDLKWQAKPGPTSSAYKFVPGPVLVEQESVVVASRVVPEGGPESEAQISSFSQKSGATLWNTVVQGRVTDALAADPKGRIFVGTISGWLHAISKSGAPLWKKKLEGSIRSPAIGCNGWMLVSTSAAHVYRVSTKGDVAPVKLFSAALAGTAGIGPSLYGAMGRVTLGRKGRVYVVVSDVYAGTEHVYALRFAGP